MSIFFQSCSAGAPRITEAALVKTENSFQNMIQYIFVYFSGHLQPCLYIPGRILKNKRLFFPFLLFAGH